MPYTITDAIQDELEFLRELAEVEKKRDKFILEAIYRQIANSHQRILNRVNSGLDYSLEIVNGEIERVAKKSNRKTLEEEYPALKKAAEQYNIVEKLVNSTPDD
jgi:hemerythrin-like domain-containing protein